MSGLVLSLFPGLDLLGMAFGREGYCVVRGPDLIFGEDVRDFHPPAGRFNGVVGGPPCQLFSTMAAMNPYAGRHGDQIPEFERCVLEAGPDWFVMENVTGAPIPRVAGYVVQTQAVRDVWVGGETSRLRNFSFGTRDGTPLRVEWLALHRTDPELTVLGGHGPAIGQRERGIAGRDWKECARLQGLSPEWIATFAVEAPFTVHARKKAIGNSVPLPMGRAVARAVKAALERPAMEAAR